MPDYVPPNRRLYLTPNAPGEGRFCLQLSLPDDPDWIGLIDGALTTLAEAASWRQVGELTPEETAAAMLDIFIEAWNGGGACTSIQTPFWDTATDVDDQYSPDLQPWYGAVSDPEAPPGELTFVENVAIWAFTGMLAVSGTPAAAIAFHTVAPAFVLAMRGDDFGEVIRIVVDGYDAATVDTAGHSGEVLRVPIAGDPSLSEHDILIINMGAP